MKKSVVIVIALIYVAAIALVSFWGLNAKTYNDNVYVESITVTADHEITLVKGEDSIHFLNEFKADGTRTVQLYCEVKPADATNPKVNYVLEKDNTVATVNENGLITINEPGTHVFPVYISSAENPTISKKIIIWAIDTSEYE
jgi:nitrogen fixation-related uncharacterized protein